MKKHWKQLLFWGFGAVCGLSLNVAYHSIPELNVIVKNNSDKSLIDVVLIFPEGRRELGDIESGEKKSIKVRTDTEGYFNATWQNRVNAAVKADGLPVRFYVRDRGMIEIAVKDDERVEVTTDIISTSRAQSAERPENGVRPLDATSHAPKKEDGSKN